MLIFKLLSNAIDSGKWTPITWYISDKYLLSFQTVVYNKLFIVNIITDIIDRLSVFL